ncbi:hypothetical protein [Xanthocytophaga flava]|uniref:hypothetical protein n=1 Tax=Xanthocytophaga flava TaxID=3048013 RepID=UPI0028D149C7|nr:hypothetical protein [Xanthocytophaga flavus]MDJ1473350.1 hypothetical protein [Xanthocytophaga flavus]
MQKDYKALFLKWGLQISFCWLLLAAGIGVFLRYMQLGFLQPITVPENFQYSFWLHTHSHVMFLGWIFNILYVTLIDAFVDQTRVSRYRKLFIGFQLMVLGMLISFPVQGYGPVSIAFSALHMFGSYLFAIWLLTDAKSFKEHISFYWIRWGLFYMVLSSIGPFLLGIIKAKGLAGTYLYNLAIYFYLHFQYNGWFIFVCIGLFFRWLEQNNLPFRRSDANRFLMLTTLACIPTFALSALWIQPPIWVYLVGGAGAIVQLWGMVYFFRSLYPLLTHWQQQGFFSGRVSFLSGVWIIALIAFIVKLILQLISVLPSMAMLAYQYRSVVIAYLHVVFIGVVSCFLLGYLSAKKLLEGVTNWFYRGVWLWISGFILHGLLLILPIFNTKANSFLYPVLFGISFWMWLGIGLLTLGIFSVRKSSNLI